MCIESVSLAMPDADAALETMSTVTIPEEDENGEPIGEVTSEVEASSLLPSGEDRLILRQLRGFLG